MNCPSCYEAMSVQACDGVAVDVCVKCPAAWLAAGELESLQAAHGRRGGVVVLPESSRFSPEAGVSLVRCQSCRTGRLVPGRLGTAERRAASGAADCSSTSRSRSSRRPVGVGRDPSPRSSPAPHGSRRRSCCSSSTCSGSCVDPRPGGAPAHRAARRRPRRGPPRTRAARPRWGVGGIGRRWSAVR
ncbi:MAG: zf-TFIIB domain-containing protein [Acidobacteria bacterium]|nr:zf-TFIIB domain-containing protein [Acidobacteriota bacterium]